MEVTRETTNEGVSVDLHTTTYRRDNVEISHSFETPTLERKSTYQSEFLAGRPEFCEDVKATVEGRAKQQPTCSNFGRVWTNVTASGWLVAACQRYRRQPRATARFSVHLQSKCEEQL